MAAKIHVVTASAGAGKTTRIVADLVSEVERRSPEALVATTFTIKAADELIERARAKLFETGKAEAASRLLGARFGTVNAVCGQIAAEFAIDLGRSPATEVISPDSEPHLFAAAANEAITAHATDLNRLADRFGYYEPAQPGTEPPDWRKTLRNMITLARANGLGPDDLRTSATRSVETFAPLIETSSAAAEALDQALANAVAAALQRAPATISTKGQPTLSTLQVVRARFAAGERPGWPDWVRLSNAICAPTKDGRDYEALLQGVAAAAVRHCEHPGLRADCEAFSRGLFSCAADAMDAYQDFKAQRGLLDFTDQETLALQVLSTPATAARLAERVERVFVDEFQDSSPIQMALFSRLAEVVEASTWVGDPKQAIFGFRGADSDLTQAAFDGVLTAEASAPDILAKSYRSRDGIVRFSNALFSAAFERMGLASKQHDFSGTDRSEDGLTEPALAYWPLAGAISDQTKALADGVQRLIAAPESWLVGQRQDPPRPLRSGDIAILCRTNEDVAAYAAAIAQKGIPVAVERKGLTRTPHVELVLAAYRLLVDGRDRLALAELARFFAKDPASDAWLVASAHEDPHTALSALVPIADALDALRTEVLQRTPSELIDAVMSLPAVMARIEQWGDHAIRLDDLEALRGCARTYEAECASGGVPATPSGLILALLDANPKRPSSLSPDAVQVMTYHTAKGLEWPLVILTGLGKSPKARHFSPTVEVDGAVDWKHPLANRWIRYWPWPYNLQAKGGALETNAANSPLGKAAQHRTEREDTRLLYVGVTRARDYLVLSHSLKAGIGWLSVLDPAGSAGHVQMPTEGAGVRVGSEAFPCRTWALSTDVDGAGRAKLKTFVRKSPPAATEFRPLFIQPSVSFGGLWVVTERTVLGDRLALKGRPDMQRVGQALHGFLAADDPTAPITFRQEMARDLLDRWSVHELDPTQAIEASDRLHRHLGQNWPARPILREATISARIGDQALSGRMDLLIDGAEGYAVVDHKSFPGSPDLWETRAIGYGAQLHAYANAVRAATGKACSGLYIHMPLVGMMLRVEPSLADEAD